MKERIIMICLECGREFKKTINKNTIEAKCPKCGGYDTDVKGYCFKTKTQKN
jgi:Zn finger protein HypA/HybF involved in hydrogenase expression